MEFAVVCTFLCFLAFGISAVAAGEKALAAIDFSAAAILVGVEIFHRTTRKYYVNAFIALFTVGAAIISFVVFGFAGGATHLWGFLIPPMAVFLLGGLRGAVFVAAFLAVLHIFIFFVGNAVIFSKYGPGYTFRVLSVFILITMVSVYYDFFRSKIKKEYLIKNNELNEAVRKSEGALAELFKSEQKYKTLIEKSRDAILIVDFKTIVFANLRAKEFFRRDSEELENKEISDFFSERDRLEVETAILGFKNGSGDLKEFKVRSEDGGVRTIELSGGPINYENRLRVLVFLRDATQRKMVEDDLRREKAALRAVLDNSTDFIWSIDCGMRLTAINRPLVDFASLIAGVEVRLGDRLPERLPDSLKKDITGFYAGAIAGESLSVEREVDIGISQLHFEASFFPIRSRGEIIGVSCFARDVTERKLAENALKESETKYRNLFVAANDGIALLKKGIIAEVNDKTSELFGGDQRDLIGKSILDFTPESRKNDLLANKDFEEEYDLAENGESRFFEWNFINDRNEPFDAEISMNAVSVFGEDFVQVVIRDITARKIAEEQLIIQKNRLDEVFYGIEEGIVIVDDNEKILFANPALGKIFGKTKTEIVGTSFFDYFDEKTCEKIKEQTEIRKTGRKSKYMLEYITDKDEKKFIELSVSPRFNSDKEYAGAFAAILDITEKEQTKNALEAYKRDLEELVEQRTADLEKSNLALQEQIQERKNVEENIAERLKYEEALGGFSRALIESETEDSGAALKYLVFATNASKITVIENAEDESHGVYMCERFKEYNFGEPVETRLDFFEGLYYRDGFERWEENFIDGKPIFGESDKFPEDEKEFLKKNDVRSILALPIFVMSKLYGFVAFIDKDRSRNWQFESGFMQTAADMIGSFIERYKTHAALKENENKYRNLFERSNDAILIHDFTGKILDANAKAARLVEINPWELIGYNIRDAFKPENSADFRRQIIRLSKEGAAIFEARFLGAKSPYDVEISSGLIDEEQRIFQSIIRDITESKKLTAGLKDAKEKAEEANRLKSLFLANVSHEIRTPMNGIIGFSEIILGSEELSVAHDRAKSIIRESEALLKLLNRILDHAKIESGKTELEIRPTDLYNLLERIVSVMHVQASEKGLDYRLRTIGEPPQFVECDAFRLRQILMNLSSNAVKFTEEGRVELSVKNLYSDGEMVDLMFAVEDTGIGIPKDRIDTIFQSFVQADGSTTRKYGGTGLGTTISKQLVELMGGSMGLESEPGRGSKFWFVLRLRICDPIIETVDEMEINEDIQRMLAEERKISATSILVVEDYGPNQEVAKMHLENAGHKTTIAGNGAEAVELCRKEKFDLILMDVQMPVMDGLEATRQIRTTCEDGDKTTIIALTANADEETRSLCREAGMNDLVTKPIRKKNFLSVVDKWLFFSPDERKGEIFELTENESGDTEIHSETLSEELPEEVPPVDFEAAIEEFESLDFIKEMFDQFLLNIEAQIPKMESAIAEADTETVRKEAHAVKGGAFTLEARPLAEAAKKIESLAKEERIDEIENMISVFKEKYVELKKFVEEYMRKNT